MINDTKAPEFIRSIGHIGDADGLRCLSSNQTNGLDACSRAKPARMQLTERYALTGLELGSGMHLSAYCLAAKILPAGSNRK